MNRWIPLALSDSRSHRSFVKPQLLNSSPKLTSVTVYNERRQQYHIYFAVCWDTATILTLIFAKYCQHLILYKLESFNILSSPKASGRPSTSLGSYSSIRTNSQRGDWMILFFFQSKMPHLPIITPKVPLILCSSFILLCMI